MVVPGHALDCEPKASCYKFHSWIRNWYTGYSHKSLLNQARADAPRAKALGEENFLQLHVSVCHARIVSRR